MSSQMVFVSHSHQDNPWCRKFVPLLQKAGFDVWYDEKGLSGGASWISVIENKLHACDIFLLVLSPASWKSEWVQREIQLALVTKRMIVPIKLEETEITGFLLTLQWVDAVGADINSVLQNTIDAISSVNNISSVPQSIIDPTKHVSKPAVQHIWMWFLSQWKQMVKQKTIGSILSVIVGLMMALAAIEYTIFWDFFTFAFISSMREHRWKWFSILLSSIILPILVGIVWYNASPSSYLQLFGILFIPFPVVELVYFLRRFQTS